MDSLDRVRAAFDPERFRSEGHAVIDILADYLSRAQTGDVQIPVLPWLDPHAQVKAWPATFPSGEPLSELFDRVIAASIHLHHPHYVGHQVTAPLPAAALADLVSSLLNNSMAVYEMGPASTAMEQTLLRFLAATLQMPPGADGVFTSGGSAGNLTALLAARQAKAPVDVWTGGLAGGALLAFLVSEQAHYSVDRAMQIMGLGRAAAFPIPVDGNFRLRADALPVALGRARDAGRTVIGVVASAGSTATGAFDPLDAVADFCADHDLWLHVDAAHGGPAAFSPQHRALVHGIGRADSVVFDAHKLMLMPALITAVIFRDGARSYDAFKQEASYLFVGRQGEDEWWNAAQRTLECTKFMMCLKLFTALTIHGPGFFADYIDDMFALSARFADRIESAQDFELAIRPACNIVCFRYTRPGVSGLPLDDLQARLRRTIVESGAFHLVQTRLPTGLYLRVTLLNPFTRDADLDALLDCIRATPG